MQGGKAALAAGSKPQTVLAQYINEAEHVNW